MPTGKQEGRQSAANAVDQQRTALKPSTVHGTCNSLPPQLIALVPVQSSVLDYNCLSSSSWKDVSSSAATFAWPTLRNETS